MTTHRDGRVNKFGQGLADDAPEVLGDMVIWHGHLMCGDEDCDCAVGTGICHCGDEMLGTFAGEYQCPGWDEDDRDLGAYMTEVLRGTGWEDEG